MPELPEVATIVHTLKFGAVESDQQPCAPSVTGFTLASGQVLWARTLALPAPEEFAARIRGQQIVDIDRRGKYIVVRLTADTLLFHLRMSGDLRVESAQDENGDPIPWKKHDRLALTFRGGWRLVFNDPRKFGRAWLVEDPQVVLGSLGPEPLDSALGVDEFHQKLVYHRRQLKPLLLDQSFIAGLGNIYTDEALHLAHLHPLRISSTLTRLEAGRLLESIRSVLQEGIRRNGASIDWVYRGGDFQNAFRVYSRTGQPCLQCGTIIERILVGQRATHFCIVCQPLSRPTPQV